MGRPPGCGDVEIWADGWDSCAPTHRNRRDEWGAAGSGMGTQVLLGSAQRVVHRVG
jgi:hypothetical protein